MKKISKKIKYILVLPVLISIPMIIGSCFAYFKGFTDMNSNNWEFAAGDDSCSIWLRFEGERTSKGYYGDVYQTYFSVSDGGSYKVKSLASVLGTKLDSLEIKYPFMNSTKVVKQSNPERKKLDSMFFIYRFSEMSLPESVDTIWVTLYIRTYVKDKIIPLSHKWHMYRDDSKSFTLYTD